jgi:heme/copper-type cytochrome/quinol oxidase subunit 2
MTGVIVAIWPIAALIVLVIAAIPLWMIFRHRRTSDAGPAGPAAAVDGLTIVRRTRTADDDGMAIPAQRHW